ncbi:MAG: hypothetical protein V8R52_07615 [Coprobacter fastidiosus]
MEEVNGQNGTGNQIMAYIIALRPKDMRNEIDSIACQYEITTRESLNDFINEILNPKIFDAEKLNDAACSTQLGMESTVQS